MKKRLALSTKLISIGVSLLVVGLVSIGLTLWVTRQLEGGAAAVNEAGRMRMQTWRLSSSVQAGQPLEQVQELIASFDASIALLHSGDPARPLFLPDDANVKKQFASIEALWQVQRRQWVSEAPPNAQESMRIAGAFVNAIDAFVLVIEQQLSRLTAILNLFQIALMALAIGGAVIMLYTGYMFVISPLAHLRSGLRKVETGDFTARVDVDTHDEFGQVADGFNEMATRLQALYDGLESEVERKTHRIEAQRARLEALYDVSAFLSIATSLVEAGQGFAERVKVLVGADAAAVRWIEDGNQSFQLLASVGFPDELLDAERSLAASCCSCGDLRSDSRTRVIPIHDEGAMPIQQCRSAGFQTVVSVPIRLQHRLVGEFNLLYRRQVLLNADETELLDALVSHLASALESMRAAALEREAAVSAERASLASELHDSIAQSLAFLKIQLQLLRTASLKSEKDKVSLAMDELDVGLRESINDVRELLMHFRTRTNSDDIEPALQETLLKFRHQTGLPAQLEVTGTGLNLAPDVQVQVLHVVQEALSNVRKHACASQVKVAVNKGEQWRVTVQDDGRGFDPQIKPGSSHVGLNIMQERAQRINAHIDVVSALGQGTRVTLSLPMTRNTSSYITEPLR